MKRPFSLFLNLISLCVLSQEKIDSLQNAFKTCPTDTCRAKICCYMAKEYAGRQEDSVYKYSSLGLKLSDKADYALGKLMAREFLGQYYWSTGNLDKALDQMQEKLRLLEKRKHTKMMAQTLGNIGIIYHSRGDLEKALDYYLRSMKIEEELGNTSGIGRMKCNVGSIYLYMGDYQKALENFTESYRLASKAGDVETQINSLSNIGSAYYEKHELQKSLEYYEHTYELIKKSGSRVMAGSLYLNIGNIYMYKGDSIQQRDATNPEGNRYFSKALQFLTQAIDLAKASGDMNLLAQAHGNIGELYGGMKLYAKAEENLLLSLNEAITNGDLYLVKIQHYALSSLYEKMKNHNRAFLEYKKYILVKDSIFNEESTKKTVRLEMNYEFEKKEAAARLEREKKEAVATAESRKQQIIIYSVCGILLLVFGFAVFAYRSYLQKQKANEAILHQKNIIEEKQKEILDSIHYAQRIQRALLTSEKYIDRELKRMGKNG